MMLNHVPILSDCIKNPLSPKHEQHVKDLACNDRKHEIRTHAISHRAHAVAFKMPVSGSPSCNDCAGDCFVLMSLHQFIAGTLEVP